MRDVPIVPMGQEPDGGKSTGEPAPRPWQTARRLSSTGGGTGRESWLDEAEHFLGEAGFDRTPWIAVVLALGIVTWFVLPGTWLWGAAIAGGAGTGLAALALWPAGSAIDQRRANLRLAIVTCGLVFAFGVALVWVRSTVVGAEPIARPMVALVHGKVLAREDQPAEGRLRLTLAVRLPG